LPAAILGFNAEVTWPLISVGLRPIQDRITGFEQTPRMILRSRLLVTLVTLSSLGCTGTQGPAGEVGAQGPAGEVGAQGATGPAGTTSFAGMQDQLTDAQIADGAISGAKLTNGTIASEKLEPGSISNTELADDAVTTPKLAAGAVSMVKLQDGAVSPGKLSFKTVQSCSPATLVPEYGAVLTTRNNVFPVIRLPDSISPQARVYCMLSVPSDRYSGYFQMRIHWATDTASTGVVSWIFGARELDVGADLTDSTLGFQSLDVPIVSAGHVITSAVPFYFSGVPGTPILLWIMRDGTSLVDTANGNVDLLSVELSETEA
jgi:hypothetical protein